jgi:hypothetical protein
MELKEVRENGISVVLTAEELLALCNALNEVCNGLEVPEFATRIGIGREDALRLLRTANGVYDKVAQHT